MRKAYLKSTGRLFLKHILRLLSIAAIFVVTISLISGLGDVQTDIKRSINVSYEQDNIHDITVRSRPDYIAGVENALKEDPRIKDIDRVYTYDVYDEQDENYAKRVIFMNFANYKTDKLELIKGEWPKKDDEVVVERSTKDVVEHEIGQKISVNITDVSGDIHTFSAKVVGIVKNPTMIALTREPSVYMVDPQETHIYLNDVFYFPDTNITSTLLAALPALSVTLKDRSIFNTFSDKYIFETELLKREIQDFTLGEAVVYSLADDNYSLWSLNMYADKVGVLATIFIVFFILIAILVVYSTMSRLLDEDRGAMAVLKTLGYSNFAIGIRYVVFVLIAGVAGAALSLIPARVVNLLIFNAFGIQYAIKPIELPIVGPYFFILSGIILLSSLVLTLIKSTATANHRPVELLTPKTAKVGRGIVLERIKGIWNRLSFKYKSTYRNVFLFKARLAMTILSIMAATVLVFASFALLNNANVMHGFESLRMISILLLAFSAALCALVIYNITNINISERTREIATLMVLGYRSHEVTGYVYREIYILTAIGAILGLPAGVGFIVFVFKYIGVFELSNVAWWSYLVSPIITFTFAFLATRLLHYKIIKTDMNESLKVLE